MFAELKIELISERLNYRKSSNLQGVIMENICSDYAAYLHHIQQNPYSQFYRKQNDKQFWIIRTCNQEAYNKILLPMAKLESFKLKGCSEEIKIVSHQIQTVSDDEFLKEFYGTSASRYLHIHFFTPTAFKQDGRYINYPNLRLLYGSLMRKYSAISNDLNMADEKTLEQLVNHSDIVKYRLKSVTFPLEQVQINGFTGDIVIRVMGTDTMASYLRLLFRFGKYSGIGIKTGIGMGAMELDDGERR